MPLKPGKSKATVSSNISEFHTGKTYAKTAAKYGKAKANKQAIAVALSTARKYARGGTIDPEDLDPSHKGTVPKQLQYTMDDPAFQTWKRQPQRYAEGGDTDIPDVGDPMIPSGGEFSKGTNIGNKAADIGSKLGYGAMEGAATLPYRYMKSMVDAGKTQPGSEEAHQAYGDVGATTGEMGLSMVGPGKPVPNASGVMVGPYGAMAFRNAAKETGNVAAENALTHPVVGKSLEKEVADMPPWMRDPYRNSVQESRDDAARAALEAGHPDAPVWHHAGWERTSEGAPVKEIPDVGARLVKIPGTDKFRLDHPAGDFHKTYDIPPISFDESMKKGHHGYTSVKTDARGNTVPLEIVLGGKPTAANVKSKLSTALHEVQHFVDAREGRVPGDFKNRGKGSMDDPLFTQEHFPGFGHEPLPFQAGVNKSMEKSLDKNPERQRAWAGMSDAAKAESKARFQTYLNNISEVRARNVQERLRHSFKYLEKPEFTEDVTRGLQWGDKKAGGGSVGNFNTEKASAFGLAKQGLIKSSVPGRTDKLNLDVPSGSYVIPADIPSAIGQGNSSAGASILDKMFNKGPYGMNMPRSKGPRMGARQTALLAI